MILPKRPFCGALKPVKTRGQRQSPSLTRCERVLAAKAILRPERLPVCDALESALHLASAGPAPIPELAAALNDLSPRLQWKRRNSSPPDGTSFHDGHANALVAGPGGLGRARRCVGRHQPAGAPCALSRPSASLRKKFTSRWPAAPGGTRTWTGPRRGQAASSTTNPTCSTPCEPRRSRCSRSGACGWERVRTLPAIPPAHENDRRPCNGAGRLAPVSAIA